MRQLNTSEIILKLYRRLISLKGEIGIPIKLRQRNSIGTVQDDPFDCWIENAIRKTLPKSFDVYHSGTLTTPDLVIRDRLNGFCVGLEIKKLEQDKNGKDSRGLTMDYNSCLPCGSTMVKVGTDTVIVPCYYLFALLNPTNTHFVSLILLDGDFINYDFELYKEAKFANYTEYQHGPYGEGSIRHRRMYTYPNPLNYKIREFYHRFILIAKKSDIETLVNREKISEQIIRTDVHGNSFYYYLVDETNGEFQGELKTLVGIFDECKLRTPKERTVAIPQIPPIK